MACADYSQQPLSPGRRDVYINIFLHMRDARPVRRCGRAEKQFGILCARVVPHVAVRILSDGELRVEKTGVKVFVCARRESVRRLCTGRNLSIEPQGTTTSSMGRTPQTSARRLAHPRVSSLCACPEPWIPRSTWCHVTYPHPSVSRVEDVTCPRALAYTTDDGLISNQDLRMCLRQTSPLHPPCSPAASAARGAPTTSCSAPEVWLVHEASAEPNLPSGRPVRAPCRRHRGCITAGRGERPRAIARLAQVHVHLIPWHARLHRQRGRPRSTLTDCYRPMPSNGQAARVARCHESFH